MDVKTGFFYLFSVVLLFASFRVVTARNPVHAVLFLMLAFSQASGLWLLLQAEFLAMVLVLVYLGAVMVLFLFVVMMLDLNLDTLRKVSGNTFLWLLLWALSLHSKWRQC
jgi:NADH-quinone oxidoreductase subunit J